MFNFGKQKGHPAEFDNIDFELYFVTEVLKLHALHYGYWEKNESLNLENVRRAQTRYRDTLIDLIPPGAKTVLDVGSGIGDLSKALVDKGYVVTALSPAKNHKKFYEGHRIDFHNVTFEDFVANKKFDIIIMSESSGYFDYHMALPKCKTLLTEDGYFINSGLFRNKDANVFSSVRDDYEGYVDLALHTGFAKIKEIDVSLQTLPTLEYCWKFYQEYFLPTSTMVGLYLDSSAPIKMKVFKFLFAKQLKELKDLKKFYGERLDPQKFFENARYLRLVFQNSPSSK